MKKLAILFITLSVILIYCNIDKAKALSVDDESIVKSIQYSDNIFVTIQYIKEDNDFVFYVGNKDNLFNKSYKVSSASDDDLTKTPYWFIRYYFSQSSYSLDLYINVYYSNAPIGFVTTNVSSSISGTNTSWSPVKASLPFEAFNFGNGENSRSSWGIKSEYKEADDVINEYTFDYYSNSRYEFKVNKAPFSTGFGPGGTYNSKVKDNMLEYCESCRDIITNHDLIWTAPYDKSLIGQTIIAKNYGVKKPNVEAKFEGYTLSDSNIVRKSRWTITPGNNCDGGYCSIDDEEFERYKKMKLKYQFEDEEIKTIDINNQYINLTYEFEKNGTLFFWLEDENGEYVVGKSIIEDKIGKLYNKDDDKYEDLDPTITYTIKKAKIGGYEVTIKYGNLDLEKKYVKQYNLTTGEEKTLISGQDLVILDKTKPLEYTQYNYLTYDTILNISIYNKEDDYKVAEVNIDISNVLIDTKSDTYIKIHSYNVKGINSVAYSYQNTKSNMTCFYKFDNTKEIEEDCSQLYIKKADYNTYLSLMIKENDTIIYKKVINLNFIKDYPTIKLKSWYDSNNSVQKVDINISNTNTNTDTYYYSYDNETWTQFNSTYLQLEFYANIDLYVKVKRNDKDVSYAYIYVIYNSWENGNPTGTGEITGANANNLLLYFDSLSEINTDITELISKIWQSIKSNKISIFILINIIGTAIILIFCGINRN